MRILAVFLFTITTGIINNGYAAEQPEVPDDVLKDEAARLNYSVGYQIGSDFKYQEFEVRAEAVLKGIEDALSGGEALMSKQEMRQTMADMGRQVAELKKKKRQNISIILKKIASFCWKMPKNQALLQRPAACNTGLRKLGVVWANTPV